MQFLRENLFLVCVGGGVVIAAAVLLFLASPAGLGSSLEEALEERVELRKQIDGASVPISNQSYIRAEDNRIDHLRKQRRQVARSCIRWNRGDYRIPTVVYDTVASGPRRTPIFPMDAQLWNDYSLAFKAALAYRDVLGSLRETMDPVEPYTREESDNEKKRLSRKIEARQRAGADRPPDAPPPPDRRPNPQGPPPPPPADAARKTRDINQQAHDNLIAAKAFEGSIYVEPDVFSKHDLKGEVTPADIYFGVVKLWVMDDILRAIRRTNAAAGAGARAAGIEKTSVIDSAVKELSAIEISSTNYTSGRVPVAAELLTGRATSTDYTVITYSFTVVMAMKHLPLLQRKLMAENFHTVLSVSGAEPQFRRDRYYGTAPVMEISLTCELLLLSEWERGNDETSEFKSPEDISGWKGLVAALRTAATSAKPTPARKVWEYLNRNHATLLGDIGKVRRNQQPSPATQAQLVRALNGLLKDRTLYSSTAWKDVPLSPYLTALLHKLQDKRLTGENLVYFNREILHAAMPDVVTPSPHYPPLAPPEMLQRIPTTALREIDRKRMPTRTGP